MGSGVFSGRFSGRFFCGFFGFHWFFGLFKGFQSFRCFFPNVFKVYFFCVFFFVIFSRLFSAFRACRGFSELFWCFSVAFRGFLGFSAVFQGLSVSFWTSVCRCFCAFCWYLLGFPAFRDGFVVIPVFFLQPLTFGVCQRSVPSEPIAISQKTASRLLPPPLHPSLPHPSPHHHHQLHSPHLPSRDPTATPQVPLLSPPLLAPAPERERNSPFSSLASWSSAGKRKKKMRMLPPSLVLVGDRRALGCGYGVVFRVCA